MSDDITPVPRYISRSTAAQQLGVSMSTLLRLEERKVIQAYRIAGSRSVRYRADDVAALALLAL